MALPEIGVGGAGGLSRYLVVQRAHFRSVLMATPEAAGQRDAGDFVRKVNEAAAARLV